MASSNPTPTRRKFLRDASLFTSLATTFGVTTSSAQSPSGGSPSHSNEVRLGIASICYDGFGNEHHEPTFRMAPTVGITDIEFNLWHPEMLTPRYLDRIAARSTLLGLRPVSLQGTGFGGGDRNGQNLDVAHKLWFMTQAKRLGCSVVKFTGRKRNTAGGLAHVISVCRELAPAAENMGIKLVLENHAGNVLENAEDYAEIFAAIDSPNLGMCLDTGHFEGAGIMLKSIVDQFRSKVMHVDLKDCAAFGAGHNTVVFGRGITDFDAFLSDLIAGGYTGHLIIEMAWREPREPIIQNLQAARKQFSRYVAS